MLRIAVGLLVLACSPALPAASQSLGDVAKRERERREKNKEDGLAVHEFSEDEIFAGDETPSSSPSEAAESTAEEPDDDEDRFDLSLQPAQGQGEGEERDLDRDRSERRRSEAEWRGRMHEARSRVEAARARKQQLEGLFLPEGGYYVDAHGRVIVKSRAHLQELVRAANQELDAAEESLRRLQDEARRAGVPPGWLR